MRKAALNKNVSNHFYHLHWKMIRLVTFTIMDLQYGAMLKRRQHPVRVSVKVQSKVEKQGEGEGGKPTQPTFT